ncbi:MAG: FAD-dependent oxidoreductase [Dehalococcoidia bacterium]|nr:FAD-dependent oxidoreductase [Dehalococcoidia bacterium]
MEPITVLLVEDYPQLRKLLRGFLVGSPDISLVGEAETGREALLRARETLPDVAVVDISLPDLCGIELVRTLKKERPEVRAILLLEEENVEYAKAAQACGASGYLSKIQAPLRLLPLIQAVHRGIALGVEMQEKTPEANTSMPAKDTAVKRYRVVQADLDWFLKNISCQDACPAHTDVPTYAALISQGRFEDAFQVNRRYNVFPSILGRICSRVCQSACRRARVDGPVSICYLKRSTGDLRGGANATQAFGASLGLKVAVVGAGPAGLTVASDLAVLGYRTVIFEALQVVGGMLRVGIPAYRLPRALIDEAAAELRAAGTEIRLNTPIGRDVKLENLVREYQAVVIAAGAHKPEKLGIPGEDLEGVIHGVTFMRLVNLEQEVSLGKRVAVIGLGHTAVDCARSAIRLGAEEVHVVYRRSAAEASAGEEEIREAEEEGIKFHFMVSPVRALSEDGRRVSGLACLRNRLGDPDAGGRRRPIAIPDSDFVLPIDTLIPAVSQSPDVSFLDPEINLELSRWDRLVVEPQTFMTSQPGIFAVGDFITGPRDVIHVIADAHRTAAAVDIYLRGPREVERFMQMEILSPYKREGSYLLTQRQTMPTLPPEKRRDLEAEVELGYSVEQALAEASRCLQCQVNVLVDSERCILCGGCVDVCPYNAFSMVPLDSLELEEELAPDAEKGAALLLNEERCVRCGLCENRCPTKAISMVRLNLDKRSRYFFQPASPQGTSVVGSVRELP